MLSPIRRWFRSNPELMDLLKPWVRKLGYAWPIHKALEPHLNREPLRVIQVGANDGVTHDPYRQYLIRPGWQSVVIEPIPWSYKLLERNYRSYPNVKPLQAAVSYTDTSLGLWTFKENFLNTRKDALVLSTLASFSRETLLSGMAPDDPIRGEVEEVRIPAVTLEQIMEKQGWDAVDGLFLDVEGYENEILLRADLPRLRPKIVVFEHHMLPDEGKQIRDLLASLGFNSEMVGSDTICVSQSW